MKLLLPITVGVLVFALGWLSGRGGPEDSAQTRNERTPAVHPDIPAAAKSDRLPVIKDIEDILKRYQDPPTRLAASRDLLDWIDQSDEAAMRAILDKIAEHESRALLTFLLLSCFVEQSVDAAIDWSSGMNVGDEDLAREIRTLIYLRWYSSDPGAALAAVNAEFEGRRRTDLIGLFDSHSAATRTGKTLREAIESKAQIEGYIQKALLEGRGHAELLRETMDSAELDPLVRKKVIEQVFKRSRDMSKDQIREMWALLEGEETLQEVAAKAIPWGEFQPLDAVRFGIELGVPKGKIRYREALRFQPDETLAFIAEIEDKEQLDDLYSTLFYGGYGGGDRSSWLRLFTDLPPEKRPEWSKFDLYAPESARQKPRQTLEWLKGFDAAELSAEGASKVLGGMAEQVGRTLGGEDMELMMGEIDELPEGVIRDHLIAGANAKLAEQDFNRALDLAAGLEGDLHLRVQNELWQDFFKRAGTEAGIVTLEAIEDPEARQDLAQRLVERGYGMSPEGRAALIDHFFSDAHDPLRDAHSLNEDWMRSDPAAAAAWALQYSDAPGFAKIVERLGERWWYQDSQATTEFVLALEPGVARDEGLTHLTSQMRQVDPQQALEWSLRFSDPERRHSHLLSSLEAIDALATSPDEASGALRTLGLPESEKKKLKEALYSPRPRP